ncbi:TetR/AcrR family transcriptional regulator [Weeksellaceae bacterium TAE3-ERU29]|nr:TetR/AcrR family transcriptional regulator [Weeksellaceae bacterium TAE3-ERU29]
MKKRKVSSGPIREKARTMDRIVQAFGRLFKREGHAGISSSAVARESNYNRSLINRYFGDLDGLVETYIKQTDFWGDTNPVLKDILSNEKTIEDKKDIQDLLQNLFSEMLDNKELQNLILWEISEESDIMKKVARDREAMGENLFSKLENANKEDVDIRALLALQIAGIYYLALHSKVNGSTFCGIDINTSEGQSRINNALSKITELAVKK